MAETPSGGVRYALKPRHHQLIAEAQQPMRKLATHIARRYNADPEDLYQLAMEEACRRVLDYDPSRGRFLSYLWEFARHAMLDVCQRERRARALNAVIAKGAATVAANHTDGENFADLLANRQGIFDDARVASVTAAVLAFYRQPTNPEEDLLDAQRRVHLKRRVDDALTRLDPTDRHLVVRHAVEDVPLTVLQRELAIENYADTRKRYIAAVAKLGRQLKHVA